MIHINKSSLSCTFFTVFLLLPFIPTSFILFEPIVDLCIISLKTISILIALYVFIKRKYSIDKFLLATIICMLVMLLPTICHVGSFNKFLGFAYDSVGLTMILKVLTLSYKDKLLTTLKWAIRILLYINFIVLIMYPNGIYQGNNINMPIRYSLFGMDNQAVAIIIPLFTILMAINQLNKKDKYFKNVDIAIFIITIVLLQSVTGIVATFFYFAFILYNKCRRKKSTLTSIMLVFVAAFVSVVIFRVFEFIPFIIVDVLKKDLTLSGRVTIWESAFKTWLQYPIFGHGFQETESLVYFSLSNDYRHAHNQILQILVHGGIVYLSAFVYLFKVLQKQLDFYKNSKFVLYLVIGIFSYLIMTIADSYGHLVGLYFILGVSYYLPTEIDIRKTGG